MANIPLRITEWFYVEETNRVVMQFVEQAPAGHADPASYAPKQHFTIEFTPTTIEQDRPTDGA